MAKAKRKQSDFDVIKLTLSQDEADLIFSVFGDLYTTDPPNREREIVSDIYSALAEMAERRSYRLQLAGQGAFRDRLKAF